MKGYQDTMMLALVFVVIFSVDILFEIGAYTMLIPLSVLALMSLGAAAWIVGDSCFNPTFSEEVFVDVHSLQPFFLDTIV